MSDLMDEMKTLTNDELKHRLETDFQFSCGPITTSTRNVYLKKLVKLIQEREDINININNSHDNNHQNNGTDEGNGNDDYESTVRLSAKSSPSRTRNSPRRRLEEEQSVATKTSTPKNKRHSTQTVSTAKKSSSKSRKTIAFMNEETAAGHLKELNSHSLNNYSSESSENDEKIDESLSKLRKSPRKKMMSPQTPRPLQEQPSGSQRVPFARPYPPSLTPSASKMSNILSLTRPPLRRSPQSGSQMSSKLANYSDSEDTEQEQKSTDYIRDRLLRHRPGLSIGSFGKKGPSGANGTGFEDANSYGSTSNFISFAILVIVVLFFVFIFSFYFYTRISSSPKPTVDLSNFEFIREDLVAPICLDNDPIGSNDLCLKYQSDIMPALKIAKEVKNFMDKSILINYCGSDSRVQSFSDFKLLSTLTIKRGIRNQIEIEREGRDGIKDDLSDDVVFDRDFINAVSLIQLNPNWQLLVTGDNLEPLSAITISEDYPLNLPFGCQAFIILKLNLYKIFSALLIIFMTIASIFYYKRSKKLATEEQDLIYDLVEKSLELLQSPDNPQSMPVLHIRDTLLSPSERKTSKYKKIWNKVVKHIESTESRVKVDIENIEGDDYKTWKWVATNVVNNDNQNISASTIIRTGTIEWQGQAFNNDHNVTAPQSVSTATNGTPASKPSFAAPTSFLKIRNMFNEETKLLNPNGWKNKIRSAVLEKISIAAKSGNHGVLHLEVEDSPEGLVYVKCDSIESATDAFNALHGWWCQKKLVSVKFLKPDRYHQRFPVSTHNKTPVPLTAL
ncbi:uncharacterized protein LOC128951666 [Oppia nitens]|uniref:uncharacterized protein LOC128951666 n=1 Tax=Oppia nitens TaxID=1686743 RepID=UPI0023DC689C|nr:uncharacterized protein LOC128951666 [Oppia nitens]